MPYPDYMYRFVWETLTILLILLPGWILTIALQSFPVLDRSRFQLKMSIYRCNLRRVFQPITL